MSETIKKHVEKILKTSATVAIVGATAFSQVAKAEETEEVVVVETTEGTGATGEDTALTIPEAEAKKAVAQAEVNKVLGEKEVADQAVEAAQAKLDEDREALKKATEAREQAEAALAKAEEIAKELETNPDKAADIEKEIEAKTEEVKKAKATEKEVEGKVEAQTKIVEDLKKDESKANQEVAEAEKQVKELENADQAVTDLTEEKAVADKAVSDLTRDLVTAQSELTKVTSETKTAVEVELSEKQKKVQDLNNQVNSLSNETKTVTTPGASSDIVGNNTIKTTQAFVDQFKKMNYNYASASQTDKNKLVELGKEVLALNGVKDDFYTNNGYQATVGDNRTVNLNNASEVANIQTELNLYAAELLNQVRRAFGLNDVVVTESSQLFASAVAAAYASNERYIGSTTNYSNNAYHPHRFDLVTPAGAKYGVTTGPGFENLGFSEIWAGAGYSAGKTAATVGEMKKHIQTQLVMMIFQDQSSNFLHTKTFLISDSTGKTYLGVGFNGLAHANTDQAKQRSFIQYYEIFNGSQVDASKFNTTALGGGTQTVKVDNSAKIAELNKQIATLNSEIATLNGYVNNISSHPTVQAAQNKVTDLNTKLSAAKKTASDLQTKLDQAKTAEATSKSQLAIAKANLTTAQSNLATVQADLKKEAAELSKLNSNLLTATRNVEGLENEVLALQSLLALYNNPNLVKDTTDALNGAKEAERLAQDQVTEDEKALETAQGVQKEVEDLLTTKLEALEAAETLLAALIEEYEGLLVDRDEEGIHAVINENLTEDELPVFEISSLAPTSPVGGGLAGSGSSNSNITSVTSGTGVAGGSAIQALTNKVLNAKTSGTVSATRSTITAPSSTLPITGDKSTLVATVLGSMMMSSAVLAGYKRREED